MSHTARSVVDEDDDLKKLYEDVLAGFVAEEEAPPQPMPRQTPTHARPPPGESNMSSHSYRHDPMDDSYSYNQSSHRLQSHPQPQPRQSLPSNPRPTRPPRPLPTPRPLPKPPSDPYATIPASPPASNSYFPDEKKLPYGYDTPRATPPPPPPPPPPPGAAPPRSSSYASTTTSSSNHSYHSHRNGTSPSPAGYHGLPPGAAAPAMNGHPYYTNGSTPSPQDYVNPYGRAPSGGPSRNTSFASTTSTLETRSPESVSSSGGYSPGPSLHGLNPMTKSTFELSGGIDGAGYDPNHPRVPPPPLPHTYSNATSSGSSMAGYGDEGASVNRGDSFSSSVYGGGGGASPSGSTARPLISPPAPAVAPVATPPAAAALVPSSSQPPAQQHHSHSSSLSRQQRHQEELQRTIASLKAPLMEQLDDDDDIDFEEDIDEDPDRFVILALLSHLAVRLRDKVPRGTHVKGSIPYHRAFTGKDIVSTIQSQIQRELLINMGISTNDRRTALQVARSLQSQLFFYEVEWGGRQLQDGVEDVYMFLDDSEGMSGDASAREREELPTGVITMLTKCYSPSCQEGMGCYAYSCPRKKSSYPLAIEASAEPEKPPVEQWATNVDPAILKRLPESEVNRQTIIRKVIEKEEQYVQDLDTIESLFIRPLRKNNPPIIPPDELDSFIDDVFGNVLDLRECNRRLLETMYVRQREQAPIIQRIGDIFLTAAAEFRLPYPDYVGHLPIAEKRMKEEMEKNAEFRHFVEQCSRHPDARRFDLRHFITRPSEHLQRYPVLLEAIMQDTTEGNPDADFLQEAVQAIRKLSGIAQIRTFQAAMLRGPTAKLEWYDLVGADVKEKLSKHEIARQGQIFELIKGEMEYVKDLENIETIFIQPLKAATNPPIIPRDRLPQFIEDVFYNFAEIHRHHRRMLDRLHEIQREEHPVVNSITAVIFDAALNWREAYMDFIPHYPISAYRVDEEIANNPAFKSFVEQCTRNPESRKLDIKAFIYRPIPRLLRYDLLLKGILGASPIDHEDKETIPQVLEVIKALGKDSEPGVVSAKQKVELWKYNANLVFKPGEAVDMDLLNESRTLIHAGKLLRQPETGFEWNGWSELFVLLFDNYLVMTKPKDKGDGVTKYHVNRRPIPLDLLTLANFTDPPQQRGTGILRGLRGGERSRDTGGAMSSLPPDLNGSSSFPNGPSGSGSEDSRTVYPCTIHHNGRLGGLYTLYAESAQARLEWKAKLDEALALRRAVTENNKVFEMETLSADTFAVPSMQGVSSNASYNQENPLTGKVTCSVPFSTADGMRLVAVGCAEGVWIGLRHDSKSMRRVLYLKMVTQCAMLEDFGIFLVLADRCLWAYHIEALVPSSPPRPNTTRAPQKLNNHRDVQFFSVGQLNGRTLVIYMKKKGNESVFHVLEPVIGKIAEKPKAPGTFGRSLFGSQRSDWFRSYREFFLPSESFDLIFLKAKIAVLCPRGFEIMDINDFKNVTIPQKDDSRMAHVAKRFENSRPLGMFRSSENEFLLCYDEFGVYVDRYGDPSRPTVGLIEWEGTAERVAFHPPYVLLFDTRFIEIRHIDTGRLAQIIQGTDVRCIWDGRGTTSIPPVQTPGPNGWQESPSQEARVHAVMRAPDAPRVPGGRPGAVPQHVFELVPTVPLYLPGSLSSPAGGSGLYFNNGPSSSGSPPRSPPMQVQHRWR